MNTYIVDVTVENFEQEVAQSPLPVLVDFWSPRCAPCVALAPLIGRVAEHYRDRVKVVKVNTLDAQELATRFRVRGLPTLLLLKGGVAVAQVDTTRTRIFSTLDEHA